MVDRFPVKGGIGPDGEGEGGGAARRDGVRGEGEAELGGDIGPFYLQWLLAQIGHRGGFAHGESLLQGGGFEFAGLETKIPELFSAVELAQGFLFLVHHAPQAQHHRPFDAGNVYGKRFVKGHGAVFILVGGRYGSALAGSDGSLGPLDVRAAAGGNHLVDADDLFPFVGEGEGAGEGTVRDAHVSKVVNRFVKGHRLGSLGIFHGHQFHHWRAICIPGTAGAQGGG